MTQIIESRASDIGGFSVRRVLPHVRLRSLGPFIFLDHMGPAVLPAGQGLDVGPHPHIGLSTLTYLFEGAILHRDSLGTQQRIEAGAVNWMKAGRGITHSERSPDEERSRPSHLHGLQLWVALPVEREEAPPRFQHCPSEQLPDLSESLLRPKQRRDRVPSSHVRLIAGTACEARAPIALDSPLFALDVQLLCGDRLRVPSEHEQRGLYLVSGNVTVSQWTVKAGQAMELPSKTQEEICAQSDSRLLVLGGTPLPERRHLLWNFASSRRERVQQAAEQWAAGGFDDVPGDHGPRVPLPTARGALRD